MFVSLLCPKHLLTSSQSGYPELGVGMPADYYTPHTPVYARDPSSQPILLQGAIEGQVLVKNVNNALPLSKPKMISIFGYDAPAPPAMDIGGPNAFLGGGYGSGYEPQLDFEAFFEVPPLIAPNGTMVSGGGSGANAPAYISSPFDALLEQAYGDGTSVFWDFLDVNPTVDTSTDACLVFINAFATEGFDRVSLHGMYCRLPIMYFLPTTNTFRPIFRFLGRKCCRQL
jgi:beta-glucosidase